MKTFGEKFNKLLRIIQIFTKKICSQNLSQSHIFVSEDNFQGKFTCKAHNVQNIAKTIKMQGHEILVIPLYYW